MIELPKEPTKGWMSIADVKLPTDYPSVDYFTHSNFLTQAQKDGLKKLIEEKASETEVDKYLTTNKPLWDYFFPHKGNHGIWVIPKQQIKAKVGESDRGLIPDYIICTKNSDGFQYWVVELKGITESLLTINSAREIYFSSEGNKGISQLIEYIDFCSKFQTKLREEFRFKDFREPNGILVLGLEKESDDNQTKREFKAAWNRLNPRLEIRTFNSILRRLD